MGKQKADLLIDDRPSQHALSGAMLSAARLVASAIAADRVIVFADGLDGLDQARALVQDGLRLILVVRGREQARLIHRGPFDLLVVPAVRLSRVDQVKMAVLFAFGDGLVKPGETLVALVGLSGDPVDTLMVIKASQTTDLVRIDAWPLLNRDIRPDVFQRVVHVAVSLAAEGREGKPIGVLLILGDTDRVLRYADQMIINPFHGYEPDQRDIMDDGLLETLREFAILDGAFLIRGNGLIEAAGVYLRPTRPGGPMPSGLGARHATAAGITATADCLAITISESTGAVRVWRDGRIIAEIKRAAGLMSPGDSRARR